MPRTRDRIVHPQFFTDRKLFEAERDSGLPIRVAYEGLWCAADREGRFEWKPEELKLVILPWDDVDFSEVLDVLVTRGFVVRYSCNGEQYGWIKRFDKWQKIHPREAKSKLPEPPELSLDLQPLQEIASPRQETADPGQVISLVSTSTSTSTSDLPASAGHPEGNGHQPPSKATWLTPYALEWTAGEPPFGQMAKVLKPLEDRDGTPEVLTRWRRYLGRTDPQYWSLHRFRMIYNTLTSDVAPNGHQYHDEPPMEYVDG